MHLCGPSASIAYIFGIVMLGEGLKVLRCYYNFNFNFRI